MSEFDPDADAKEPAWRERAVSRSLHAARSRAERRVQGFLDAAFELIDEKGTTEFTIQEVIDRSQQSLRGFYQYFDGKNELLLALFEETIREATDDLQSVVDAETGRVAALMQQTVMYCWFSNRLAESARSRLTAEESWEFCLHGLGVGA